MTNTWIITTSPAIGALVEAGRRMGGTVTVVAVGDGAGYVGVDAVVNVPLADGLPAEAAAPAVVASVAAVAGDVVLVPNRSAERVLAGAVAAKLGAPVLTGVTDFTPGAFDLLRFGGISKETVRVTQPTVVVMDGGSAAEGDAVAAAQAAGGTYGATVTGTATGEVTEVNLGAAKKIVCVGRGFKAEEDLQLARDLADALGAELACTRPLAEGSSWMPKQSYVGISGQRVSPDLYVAAGVSGQLQHTAGATGARTVVVINSDANAPYFAESDYGVVGDLYDVLPALVQAVK